MQKDRLKGREETDICKEIDREREDRCKEIDTKTEIKETDA